ncbi:FAD-dependent oxidoreductase [Kibdelosporangium lantanae]
MRIVILGAGYAGLTAANRLRRHADVTLVNRTDRFVERVRLHQLAAGQDLRVHPLPWATVGVVTGIDLVARTVQVGERAVDYDILVYALGSGASPAPGAYAVADLDQAAQLREHLPKLAAGSDVVVVGAGLTGIETAAEIAETFPRLRLHLVASGPLGGWLSVRAQEHLAGAFDRMNVEVHFGCAAKTDRHQVVLEDGRVLPADLVVWTAGFRVPGLAAEAGLATDDRGRVIVDDHLRSVSHPEVYGIGDAAAAPGPGGAEARMSCQTGLPMGAYVAGEITRLVKGHELRPVRIRYVWQNISLGRRDGVTQFTHTDDSPRRLVLTGRRSARFKELITRGAAWSATRT